uniref:Uncharacterized protein n=1 Tax=Arundo donax TaxID=35708 RepID=A0A0A8YSI3_ARUDO
MIRSYLCSFSNCYQLSVHCGTAYVSGLTMDPISIVIASVYCHQFSVI